MLFVDKNFSVNRKKARQVLECACPLALWPPGLSRTFPKAAPVALRLAIGKYVSQREMCHL
jgi:hypothetical protein